MEYTVFRKRSLTLNESSIVGSIECSYEKLVELFGNPLEGDGKISDVEWQVLFDNGHPVGIFNYKDGKNYLGDDGSEPETIINWTVRGHYEDDVETVRELTEDKPMLVFNAQLMGRDKLNIAQRIRSIADHIEEGVLATASPSDYHSWELKLQPDLKENHKK